MRVRCRQEQMITCDMENDLWKRGFLGDDNPETLLNTVVYLLGLYFALRGRDEHRNLRHYPSQIILFRRHLMDADTCSRLLRGFVENQ